MIIVMCSVIVPEEKRSDYIEAIRTSGALEATRAESGNISYDLVCSADGSGSMLIIERWQDIASVKKHMAGSAMKAMMAAGRKYSAKMNAEMYKAESLT